MPIALHFLNLEIDVMYLYYFDIFAAGLAFIVWQVCKKNGHSMPAVRFILAFGTIVYGLFYLDRHQFNFKIAKTCAFIIVFLYLLFPFSDLNDFVTIQVAKLTQNQVFVQFDDMSINPLLAHVSLEKVFVETGSFPSITADKISIRPGVSALTKKEPNGSIQFEGLFGGELALSVKPAADAESSSKSEEGKPSGGIKLSVSALGQNLSIKDLKELGQIKLPLKGQLSLTLDGVIDTSFREQPDAEVTITISKFQMPETSINSQMLGPVKLPELNLGQVTLKGKLKAGKLVIDTAQIGQGKDPMMAEIKGDMMLSFANLGGQVRPIIGAYNLNIDLKITNTYRENIKFFLSLLDNYKKDTTDGVNYKFLVKGSNFYEPPQFSPSP